MSSDDAVVRGTVVAKIHRMLDTIEARDAEIAQLRAERDASRLIISDLTAEVERLRAAGDALAVRYRKTFGLDGMFDAELRQWEAARRG